MFEDIGRRLFVKVSISIVLGNAVTNAAAFPRASDEKNSEEISATPPLHIFLHIPKTAGTTLRSHVKKNLGPKFSGFPVNFIRSLETMDKEEAKKFTEKLSKLDFIAGHFDYRIRRFVKNRPVKYLTVLRHPYTRLPSLYNHHVRNGGLQKGVFEKFITRNTILAENDCVRRIAGTPKVTKASLEIAKKHLSQDFIIVGVQEKFEQFLFQVKHHFKWDITPELRVNVGSKSPNEYVLSEDEKKIIDEKNSYDIELYDFALKLHTQQFKSLLGKTGDSAFRDFTKS